MIFHWNPGIDRGLSGKNWLAPLDTHPVLCIGPYGKVRLRSLALLRLGNCGIRSPGGNEFVRFRANFLFILGVVGT
jgi:hypothetical protein